ncbi:DUF4845 domain-containing protein [Pseudothauera lacus]|uniref:DUF4845 domain-containing protein n=1 Tax=Pseudothauera lacus TaxID=2136175 RepID=A0A2T4IJF6_9RHOO|nr:DUF4845 domain-containing protein [Pseudothauera lacus]PTD97903.1 DUF4845 domain-containing protein [Pseudothauera lacus]
MHNKQSGLSLVSVLILGAFFAFVLLIGFRTVPAVTEYLAVKKAVQAIAEEGDNGASVTEMRRSFDRRASVDNVESVRSLDLAISKVGGQTVVEVQYGRAVPVAGNVSLLIDFDVSNVR